MVDEPTPDLGRVALAQDAAEPVVAPGHVGRAKLPLEFGDVPREFATDRRRFGLELLEPPAGRRERGRNLLELPTDAGFAPLGVPQLALRDASLGDPDRDLLLQVVDPGAHFRQLLLSLGGVLDFLVVGSCRGRRGERRQRNAGQHQTSSFHVARV